MKSSCCKSSISFGSRGYIQYMCFIAVLVLVSDRSAVFQVTSGATALFPPGSSLDQQGSILVIHRTQ